MALSGHEIARRVSGRTEVRADAVRARFRLQSIAAADAHLIEATLSCGVVALNRPVELKMLTEVFLSDRDIAGIEEVVTHFTPALRDAAARAVEKHPAAHWLDDAGRGELLDALRAAAKPVAFNCGIDLLPPFDVSLASPTRQREKLESIQRELVERRVTGQAEHMQRAAGLLKQFQSLREAAPALSPGQVLDQVSPADRGSMLETLLLASASGTQQTLWAVAGPNLLKIDPRTQPPATQIIPLPTDLGPLRSVQGAEIDGAPMLLIGAQSGVMLVDPQHPADARRFADREVTSALGFNSVAMSASTIWATHGEAGAVAWHLDAPDRPAFTIRPQAGGEGPRNAVSLDDGRILYSAGATVFTADRAGKVESIGSGDGGVIFIGVDERNVTIARASGLVEQWDRSYLSRLGVAQRCGEATAAGMLPWLGSARLLLATADGPICCVGADDSLVTQYASSHRGLRALAAAADVVAALSADRQRIILWKSWDGRQPSAEIHVTSIARHRVADVCFA
jgi:hypothetical protein